MSESAGQAAEVTPAEDLMVEHGIIERMLWIYEQAATRIERGQDAPAEAIATTADDYRKVGEPFEEREHELFGEDGFHRVAAQVVEIEKQLGIYDLARFTPTGEGSP